MAGPWEPSSYLYTSNMEYGNHRSVCVCACREVYASSIMSRRVAIQTNTQCGQSENKKTNQKQKSLFCLTTSSSSPLCQHEIPQSLIFILFCSLTGSPPLLLFHLHPYIHRFAPSSLSVGQKKRCHAPLVLRGGNFRFVSNFRLMLVFWLVVQRLGSDALSVFFYTSVCFRGVTPFR